MNELAKVPALTELSLVRETNSTPTVTQVTTSSQTELSAGREGAGFEN
jgi:hypothetical protein